MLIAVSKSLSHLCSTIIEKNKRFDLSIVLVSDRKSWMDSSFRSLRPHYVNTVEDAIEVLEMYKEYVSHECEGGFSSSKQ